MEALELFEGFKNLTSGEPDLKYTFKWSKEFVDIMMDMPGGKKEMAYTIAKKGYQVCGFGSCAFDKETAIYHIEIFYIKLDHLIT